MNPIQKALRDHIMEQNAGCATAARPTSEQSCHWYYKDSRPCYEVMRADKSGMRPTTLSDARKWDLLPSVSTILQVLHKEALVQWKIEQAVLACLTSPKRNDEALDQFVERILHTERHQDQESDKAKQRGMEIHDAIEKALGWGDFASEEIWPWIAPAIMHINQLGTVLHTEKIVVCADGYAGRMDLVQQTDRGTTIWDFKSSKAAKLPKEAYPEHQLQLSAYAKAHYDSDRSWDINSIKTGNIYISTVRRGEFTVCEHTEPWYRTYEKGFEPLLRYWQWANRYP